MRLAIVVGSWVALLAYGQSMTPPVTFEVASVKPAVEPAQQVMSNGRVAARFAGCQGGPGSSDPGRLTCQNVTLSNFVTMAYGLKRYQSTPSSIPGWMDGAHFDIVATIPPGATREDLRKMEQNLLAERFKLVVHFEKKDIQMYDLTIAKSGPRLLESPPQPATEESQPASPPQPLDPGTLKKDADGFIILPRRPGVRGFSVLNGRMRIQAYDQTMEQFTSMLVNQMNKPVTDATGLKGTYDITLVCSADSMAGISMGSAPGSLTEGGAPSTPVASDPAPTLFEALQQQLGLKLEQKKGTIDVLFVDHAEKVPIEN